MGSELSLVWVAPFAGMLLSIALFPLVAPHFWHHHFPKISMGWAILLAAPFVMVYRQQALDALMHIMVLDYVPFLVLLWALFTISGGILVRGAIAGKPLVNAALILIGTVLASAVGTTGASMLLVRPVLRANANRRYKTHTMVFFIFLVSNIGGSLTPLGDPPLFLGFLHGVPFFWTVANLIAPMLVSIATVIAIYLPLEYYLYSREEPGAKAPETSAEPIGLSGAVNFLFLAGVIGGVLVSGYWKPNFSAGPWVKEGALILMAPGGHSVPDNQAHAAHAEKPSAAADSKVEREAIKDAESHDEAGHGEHSHGLAIPLQNLARDGILILMGILSLAVTSKEIRTRNGFTWFPIVEVAWLFAGIFLTIVPALAILGAGEKGALAFLVKAVDSPAHYFWATGVLSSFLDNAPTYLTFFSTALGRFHPGQPEHEAVAALIANQNTYLVAIAAGAVFMGANTYIGNAPNFMVRSIAEEAGVPMPDFFSYIFKYSIPVLGTTFILVTFLFFRG